MRVIEKVKGESPLWVMWCRDVSCDITSLLTSFSLSEGSDIGFAGGVGDTRVVVWYLADSSIPAAFMGEVAV